VQASDFEWVGGEPCLDFNNTVSWSPSGQREERLQTAGDLRKWGRAAGLSSGDAEKESTRALEDAIALRATLHGIFSPLSRWNAPSPADLAAFNRFLERALASARIVRGKGTFLWDFGGSGLDPVLAGVVWSAARLLTSAELRSLRECANPDCGWLFVDRSRRKNRRWCEMKECGNRAKARRYYRRHLANRGEGSPRAPLGRESSR